MSGAQALSLTFGEGETALTQRESGSNVFCTAVLALLVQARIPLLRIFHKRVRRLRFARAVE